MPENLGMVVALYTRDVTPYGKIPEDYDEIFLCGNAQEVWEYLRDAMGWFLEPKEFNPSLQSVASWRRSGAIVIYNA